MKKILLLILLSLLSCPGVVSAQTVARKYLVLLSDKSASPYSLGRPEQFLSPRAIQRRQKQGIPILERDLPVNPAYLSAIRQTGAVVWFSSRWLNAVLIQADDATYARVRALPFVKGVEMDRALANARQSAVQQNSQRLVNKLTTEQLAEDIPASYGNSRNQLLQIGVDKMHQQGFRGEGMLVGILDAGFSNADRVPYLQHLFRDNRIIGTYDFVRKETSVYEDNSHGLNVLSIMGAYAEGQLVGPAYKASFLLLRTEDAGSETPVEEANWLFGAEFADSAGVDVINSSLGYTEFDDSAFDHTYNDLDGKTTLVTRAARWAAESGMLVVVSAGNEGNGRWRYISAPADAPNVLSVGAVNGQGQKASFSSVGPTTDGRIKPDVVAQGLGTVLGTPGGVIATGNGTSFSAPLVAALATGFWQANPRLTAQQVIESLRRSGDRVGSPDNEYGYGVPDFGRAQAFAQDSLSLLVYPNPFTDSDRLTVQWNEVPANQSMEATLTNVAGQIIWRQRFPTDRVASMSLQPLNLAAGMYFLVLTTDTARRTVKILKQ